MDGSLFLILALALLGARQVCPQHLTCSVRMEAVQMDLKLETSGTSVNVTVVDVRLLEGAVTLAIHSVWMEYDVADKCSQGQLGDAIPGMTFNLNLNAQRSLIIPSTKLTDLEGKSVVLTKDAYKYCGSIVQPGNYVTAVAELKSKVFGAVTFRQHQSDSERTIIVSEMSSSETFNALEWKIVDKVTYCENGMSLQSTTNGDLSAKFGAPTMATINNSVRTSFSDSQLSLRGEGSIVGKYLVVFDKNTPSLTACAQIRPYHQREATVFFNQQGISGHISFRQASPLDKTHVDVMLQGLDSKANGYHIHVFPVPTQTQKDQALCSNQVVAGHFNPYAVNTFPSPTLGTDDQFEIGDLSSKYGMLEGLGNLSATYTDWNLPLFGKHSVVGRSVVIHKKEGNSRWVCSNIQLKGPVTSAVAVFKHPVIGHVYFTQPMDMPFAETWVYTRLGYPGDISPTSGHSWFVNDNKVGDDMLASSADRCNSTGTVYDPFMVSTCGSKMACPLGDMSGKFGTIGIGTSGVKDLSYHTGVALPLSGDTSIVGKSVVLKDGGGLNTLACATIEKIHTSSLKVDLNAGGVTGSVSFTQEPGFGSTPTKVSVRLSGFNKQNHKLQIHSLPPSEKDSKCSDLGEVYNPFNVIGTNPMTHDQFKVGDLTRGDSEWQDLNLPLSGVTSIARRSLVVMDNQSKVLACGIIQPPYSRTFDGYLVSARVVFGAPLDGHIDLFQTLYDDGATSDTSVVVDLKNVDGSKTNSHNWHVHEKLVAGDANAATGKCSSTGPHYDPFLAKIGAAATGYASQCSMFDPLRCEEGDQAAKLGTYNLGGGRMAYTDIDLPLDGMYKVQGRSIVVHVQNKGAPRYACADINPVSDMEVAVVFKTPQVSDMTEAAAIYAKAAGIDANDIVVTVMSSSSQTTKAAVYFLGLKREMNRGKLLAFLADKNKRESLSKYAPLNDPNNAGNLPVHIMLLLMTVLTSFFFSHYP